jgi:AbrB family transcriptional regulator, transcriptional pleiotropic regulator of transition state genes
MKSAGLPRKIDHLGRIVIPAELRRLLDIKEGDYVQFSAEDGRVVIDKLEERCTFCGATADLKEFRSKLVCPECVAQLGGEVR